MITKNDLKQEIEQLDEGYLELVFKLLQQFPHQQKIKPIIDPLSCYHPIDYDVDDNNELVFTDIEDAASYGKQLRHSSWTRKNNDA